MKTFWTIMHLAVLCTLCCLAVFGVTASEAGTQDEPTNSKELNEHALSPDDIAFCKTQIEAMVRDRPKMAALVRKNSAVWNWVTDHFVDRLSGTRIEWCDQTEPLDPLKQFTLQGMSAQPRHLRFTVQQIDSNGYVVDGEEQWAEAVYSLLCVSGNEPIKDLTVQAADGKLSEAEYSRECAMKEYEARKKLASFYGNVWCSSTSIVSPGRDKLFWCINLPDTYDEWIKTGSGARSSPETPYRKYYKRERARRLNNEGVSALNAKSYSTAIVKFEEALRIQPDYELAKLNLAIAFNNYGLTLRKEPRDALKMFHKASLLDPNNSTTTQNVNSVIKMLDKDPSSFNVRVELAAQSARASDYAGAVVEYTEALKIKDDSTIRQKIVDTYRNGADDLEVQLSKHSSVAHAPKPAPAN
jgi:tetratricopeptide (TPR) repeat protein